MMISNCEKVNKYLIDMQSSLPEKFELVMLIRDIFLKSNTHLLEDIKYGGLTFNLEKTLLGGIYTYKDHISIEFSNGAEFIDDCALLEGKGKKRRHLKIYNKNDITQKNSEYFIDQATSS